MASPCCVKTLSQLGKLLPPFVLILTGLLTTPGCRRASSANHSSRGEADTPAGIVRVPTFEVQQQDLAHTIDMPGTVEGHQTADLYAKIGGYLDAISVDIGDRVQQGQELAKIHVPEMLNEIEQLQAEVVRAEIGVEQAEAGIRQAEAEIARVQAELEEAKSQRREKQAHRQFRQTEYDRVKGLVESGALESRRWDEVSYQLDAAGAALDSVEARIRTAEATLRAAKTSLDKARTDSRAARAQVDVARAKRDERKTMFQYATIRAPFDGVVTKRWVHPGAFIQPAEGNSAAKPLLTVTRTDVVRVLLDLPMAEVRLLDHGDRALLDRINVLPGARFEGRVTRFSSSLNARSRMMRVEIDLENPDGRLLPGYYGYVTLHLEEFPKTPVIPSSALMTDAGETFVYVVQAGICRKRVVTTNYHDGSMVGIASGVAPGEQVVQSGGGQLADGQKVVAVPRRTS